MGAYTIVYLLFGVLIFLVLLIGMPLVNKDIKEKAKSYENGLRIGYDCLGLKDNYNSYFNNSKEPSKEEIVELFKELKIPVKEFSEKHIIISWEDITTWKFDHAAEVGVRHSVSVEMIRFKIKGLPKELILQLSSLYKKDELYVAFKEYANQKEKDSYKVPIKPFLILFLKWLILFVSCTLFFRYWNSLINMIFELIAKFV